MVSPRNRVAIEGIVDGLIGGDGKGNAVRGLGAREGKAAAGGGTGGGVNEVEIEVDMAVKVIDVNTAVAIKFRDVEV